MEKQKQLEKIVQTRKALMDKPWSEAICGFDFKTFVTIRFANSEADFREMRYPNIDEALKDQKRKLGRDLIRRVGSENMDTLMESIQ